MTDHETLTAEMIADHFMTYLCKTQAGRRHIHRVGSWLGFIIKGIERLSAEWSYHYTRQLKFKTPDGRVYRIQYDHKIGSRGGLKIVDDQGDNVIQFANLNAAEAFYNQPSLAPSEYARRAA